MGQLNPTRQEIIDAHEALIYLISYDLADAYTEADKEEVYEREQLIRKFLPPLPRLTMAEIEWDDDKHYLAEAEHSSLGKVIIFENISSTGTIKVLLKSEEGLDYYFTRPEHLTPTGRRYVLQEGE